ncbi:hypothetical protein [Halorubrum tibetense]|uniref:4Fe-4S ferredoxin iron-sulfur binding domain-containing protein n=1 Tax=Halorubrum tibetense TaxID=175631 RepID=A0ABD5S7L2_9EURY
MSFTPTMGRDEEHERSTEPATDHSALDRSDPADDPSSAPEPAMDDATVELIRDAVDVARGDLSDQTFSEKYGVGTDEDRGDERWPED